LCIRTKDHSPPFWVTPLQRVGVALILSSISKPISPFWLSFQYAIFEIADMFTLVELLEFFYIEAPEGGRRQEQRGGRGKR